MFTAQAAFSGFSVDDATKAKTFYTEVLNLDVEETEMGLQIHLPGSGAQVFVYPKEDHVPATFTVLNLVVEDIDVALAELEAQGVVFERYEGMYQDEKGITRGRANDMGPDIAWFKDPAGNIFSILQD